MTMSHAHDEGPAEATAAQGPSRQPDAATPGGVLGLQQAAGNSAVQRMFGLPFGGADPTPMGMGSAAMDNPAGAATGMASQFGGGALGYGQGMGQGAINQYVPGPMQGFANQGLGMLGGMAGNYMNQGIGMMGGGIGQAMGGMPGGSPMGMLGGLGSMLGGLF